MAIIGTKEEEYVEPRLTRIAQADTIVWYKKPNLRFLYLILVPTALGVEWTSGFDSSMMNSLQAVESWVVCESLQLPSLLPTTSHPRLGRSGAEASELRVHQILIA